MDGSPLSKLTTASRKVNLGNGKQFMRLAPLRANSKPCSRIQATRTDMQLSEVSFRRMKRSHRLMQTHRARQSGLKKMVAVTQFVTQEHLARELSHKLSLEAICALLGLAWLAIAATVEWQKRMGSESVKGENRILRTQIQQQVHGVQIHLTEIASQNKIQADNHDRQLEKLIDITESTAVSVKQLSEAVGTLQQEQRGIYAQLMAVHACLQSNS